nr:AraC family transcriptional regulator [Rhodococcus sp. (in: high G+C Gram-positive bacteria)]
MTSTGASRTRLLEILSRLIERNLGREWDDLPGVNLFSTQVVEERPTASIAEPTFAFVAQGAKRIAVGDYVLDYGPGEYLVVPVDLPVSGQFTAASRDEPFLGIGFTLNPDAIAEMVLGSSATSAGTSRMVPALGTARATVELLDALVRLLLLSDEPVDRAVLGPLVQREILWRVLRGEQGELVRRIGMRGSSLAHVGEAVRWIRTHYAEPFRVEHLAAVAAMSPSTFHRHFQAATTMGPIQFQKKIRLQQAKLLLIGSSLDVTRVAAEVGYDSPSQFSREYRREHGATPRSHARSGVQ